ncbi:hypothetical protein GQ43DRAFT_435640 [Delitschia confertaspora ATCC 74209]|uniref:Elongation of fatty acids protein n=1 Tax=Delitschia confertaspora ATCC 74209 TaxID=1513339 RepID=A0A9P4MND4_9PLEO|nr:hypothetical protein GQ43DRAFT_435640 [Delitschia confertaspora ATCC 74209]
MSGPSLHPGLPPRSLFKFPPAPDPSPIPPPFETPSFQTPFPIPEKLFTAALQPSVPLTIAIVYATTVTLTNAYNRRNGNQPWRISKTRMFKAFVILHNVFLAVYSAATCVAMFRALKRTFPNPGETNALVGTVDALCKIHGPRGLGDAVTYNTTTHIWETKNPAIHLGADNRPDTTDVGRMWNEGLAFWGWFFYLSKFYEVLDTLIILAKGKRSTTLQTYHHAGAMLCMWAGMRYMSGPIWIFCQVNSGIHAMMYTYYTLSALGYRVPQWIKRTLTTLQITQFILGGSFAAIHLFLSYTLPVSVPYETSEIVHTTTSTVASLLPTGTSSVLASATGGAAAALKKLVYRAAGEEGLAENVDDTFAGDYAHADVHEPQQVIVKQAVKKVVYRTHYQEVNCLDTTGQSFAVWVNLVYLLPLTLLFMRFFVKSYLRRSSPSAKHPTRNRRLSKAGQDAAHGVNKEIESFGKAAEDTINATFKAAQRAANVDVNSVNPNFADKQQKVVDSFNRKVSASLEKAHLTGNDIKSEAKKDAGKVMSKASTPQGKKETGKAKNSSSNNRKAVRGEEPERVVAETKIEPLEDQKIKTENTKPKNAESEGLSTTDPHDAGIAYADMVKKDNES